MTAAGNSAEDALAHHTAALAVATAIGDTHQRARAAGGLGDARHVLGARAEARHHHGQARSLYTVLDADYGPTVSGR